MAAIDPPSDAPDFLLPRENRGQHAQALFRSLLNGAIDDLSAPGPVADRAHGARKKLKRLRGLLRVVRDINPDFYGSENIRYRDIGRAVSSLRDAGALVETVDALEAEFSGQLSANPFSGLRAAFARRTRQSPELMQMRIDTAIANLHLGLAALWQLNWPEEPGADAKPLASAARRLVRDARKAARAVHKAPTSEALHELRKALKYLWVAGKLLREVWDEDPRPASKSLRALVDGLGEIHDIDAMVAEVMAQDAADDAEREAFCALIGARRARLFAAVSDKLDALDLPRPRSTAEAIRTAAQSPG